MTAIIQLQNLSKFFFTEEIETRAVNEISLDIQKGEYLSLSGPSGCGKSTLLSLMGLLDAPTNGQYILNQIDASSLNRDERARIRSTEIGFVFQSFNLISDLTVFENVMLPLTYQPGASSKSMEEKVQRVLEKVEMQHRKHHFPGQLSGGQQQRIAVARALVNDPAIILADEPTGNLDSSNAESVMALFDQLHSEGSTICMVTHDPRSAERAQRCVSMIDGQIVSDSRTGQAASGGRPAYVETTAVA